MKRHIIILFIILLIGLFFRTYQIVERYEFGHDGDLYSWIVKDIAINHHFRLIGQLTSAPGIFIGPFFYYLLVPFFLITNMDPVGALIPTILIGLATILSLYLCLSRLFNKEAGLIAAFLYAVLISTVNFDRWVVPTLPVSVWTIWFFYTIVLISRGKFSILPFLGVLIGLIWHVHIALLPTLITIPVALLISKKIPSKKAVTYAIIYFFVTSLPLILFEVRHNFSQTVSFVANFLAPHTGKVGISKLIEVLNMISKNTNSLFFSPQSLPEILRPIFTICVASTILFLTMKKIISKKEVIPLVTWTLGVIFFFSISSTLISEYYFHNLNILFLILVSLTFAFLYKNSKIGKVLILSLFLLVLVKNLYAFTTTYIYHKGYLEKKAVVNFIKNDAVRKGFPCIGISYNTAPGENVGFRYLFYLNNLHLVNPTYEVPVYNIIIPEERIDSNMKQKFGHIGVTPPTLIPSKEIVKKSCEIPNINLTDPMFAYVE